MQSDERILAEDRGTFGGIGGTFLKPLFCSADEKEIGYGYRGSRQQQAVQFALFLHAVF
jgi:hypothetical protein